MSYVKTERHIINAFYFKSCFYGFTQSIILGINLYYKNTFSAWHVSGYSVEIGYGKLTTDENI